jgi:plastocyanin
MDTRRIRAMLLVLALGCAVSSCDDASTAPPPAAPQGGTIAGTVTLAGAAPVVEPIRMGLDPTCLEIAGSTTPSDTVVVAATGAVANAFVYIRDGLSATQTFAAPSDPVVLDQHDCRFAPHVLGVQVGQPVELVNSDPTEHNVHGHGVHNPEFIRLQPVQGMRETRVFNTWMSAYIGVVPHPFFAVTDRQGRYALTGVPPGRYTIEVWHERFGRRTVQATVTGRAAVTADVVLAG